MRYYLDCEYNGFGGDLISLALVPEDGGEEFYAVLAWTGPPNDWVARNVIPYLNHVPEGLKGPPLERKEAAIMLQISEIVKKNEEMFDLFNQHFYNGELIRPAITVSPDGGHGAFGWNHST